MPSGEAKAPPSAKLRAAFRAADADQSGEVDVKELRALLSRLGVERTAAQCDDLVRKADVDGDGSLTLEEVSSLFEAAQLAKTFEELDADGSGSIAAGELSTALRRLGYRLSDDQCRELLAKVDANNDGEVSFEEFREFFQFVPLGSLGGIAEQLMGNVHLDVSKRSDRRSPPSPHTGPFVASWDGASLAITSDSFDCLPG